MSLREEKEAYIHLSDRRLVPDGPKMSSSPKDKKTQVKLQVKLKPQVTGARSSLSPNPRYISHQEDL